jgi:hypothetical protein
LDRWRWPLRCCLGLSGYFAGEYKRGGVNRDIGDKLLLLQDTSFRAWQARVLAIFIYLTVVTVLAAVDYHALYLRLTAP